MKKWERIILESGTPQEYVENSLRSKLAPAEKARLARLWMESTGFGKADILYARNRNPYWKLKKRVGADERTRRRLVFHDYSRGRPIAWSEDLLREFLGLNGKDRSGRYMHKDWELANHFSTSIPSIQYLRRKYLRVRELLGSRVRRDKIVQYMGSSELVLARANPGREA